MLIAKIVDGVVTDVADYRSMFPDTSFPSSGANAQFLADNSCLGVTVFKPHDSKIEKLVSVAPYIEDNQVFTIAVEPLTAEEIAAKTASQAAQVRKQRDDLLAVCDWTQLSDAPVDKQAWATYRQALRDISNQAGFPWEVLFPKDPNYVEPVIIESI
jgi:hypothetical protein